MSSLEKKAIRWFDSKTGRQTKLNIDQLGEHLEGIAQILNAHVDKLKNVGDLQLDEIDISVDVKGNIVLVALDGAIKLSFTRAKP